MLLRFLKECKLKKYKGNYEYAWNDPLEARFFNLLNKWWVKKTGITWLDQFTFILWTK